MSEREVRVVEDVARAAIDVVVSVLNAAIAARGQASVVLSGGGTPLALYHMLAKRGEPVQVDWPAVHVFWGDERLVAPEDPGSNYGQALDILLRRVPIPRAQIHRIRGELPAQAAVTDYAGQLLTQGRRLDPAAPHPWPRFDLVLLGLGEDGHTASLFPGSPVEVSDPVLAVTADYGGRPAQRVTLTPPVFNDARQILFLVTGLAKAVAAADAIIGPDDPRAKPAQRIRPPQGVVLWLLDSGAATRLVSRQ